MERTTHPAYASIRGRSLTRWALLLVGLIGLLWVIAPSKADAASNRFPAGYCTRFAAEVFDQLAPAPGVNWGGHAGTWVDNAEAAGWVVRRDLGGGQAGTLIVWSGATFGHVAFVNYVASFGIGVTEMNWGPGMDADGRTRNFGIITSEHLTWAEVGQRGGLRFVGFIHPTRTDAPTAPGVLPSAYPVVGDIARFWQANGGAGGFLGQPVSPEYGWDGVIRQDFSGGSVIWRAGVGASLLDRSQPVRPADPRPVATPELPASPYPVTGAIRLLWEVNGGASGFLGQPTSAVYPWNGVSRQDFGGGSIKTTPDGQGATLIQPVQQPVQPASQPLPQPVQQPQPQPAPKRPVEARPTPRPTQPSRYPVIGDIKKYWEASGGAMGFLGQPVSGEYRWEGVTRQDFEGGSVVWRPGVGASLLTRR